MAPIAAKRPHAVVSPHGTRNDPYYWLRDDTRKDKDVLAYLDAENAYTKAILAPVQPTADTLLAEFRARIKEDDASVPELDDGYWYYTRFETGKQYAIHARKKGTLTAPEQVMLDLNELAKGHAYYAVGGKAVSRNGRHVAYLEDTVGRHQYTLRIKDLQTGAMLPDTVDNISSQVEWANDNKHVFLVGKDPVSLRQDRIFRLALGGKPELLFQEPDGQYYVGLASTKSKRYVVITLGATTNSEMRLIDADKPLVAPRVVLPRSKDHEYYLDHLDGRFVIHTNADAKNFRVMEVADGKETKQASWKELVAHRPDVLVDSMAISRNFLALTIVNGGLRKVEVFVKGKSFVVDAPDPAYAMSVDDTPDPAAKRVRYAYESMTRPSSVFEIDVATRKTELLKQQPVPSYDPELYASEFIHAPAGDAKVPISLVYKKTTKLDGTAPLLVYGYGAYGLSMVPRLSTTVTSLLDRGWVYAIAHIRGGQELGRAWYEDGKLLAKKHTFTDFIAATEHLIAKRYGDRKRVFANGGSAGGLLMGAIANLRPDLYRGISLAVPFVDVVTTMMDPTIPLTTNEYDEWGNPAEKSFYDYMLSYSPYDNIGAVAYPAIYCKTGLWDSQVQYYEPAKWVAKLREISKPGNPIVLDIDMAAGHGGASGRFDKLRDAAKSYSFLLMTNDTPDPR
ncbi:MAG: S9 family peptidase [Deltaproteobacteria bacterium]|nr:S9 family peptidase [Deltaproteobacteria bacterium]